MKANFLRRNKSKSLYKKYVLGLLLLLVVGAGLFALLDSVLISSVSPLWQMENIATRGMKNWFNFLRSQKSLVEENRTLREEVTLLEVQVAALSGVSAQDEELLKLLGQKTPDMILATVLTRPPQTPYDIIIIDSGRDHEIMEDLPVLLPEGYMIGRVSEVFATKSRVTLLSKAGEETSALLERGNVPVHIVGRGGGNFKLELPRSIDVKRGDRILSLGVSPHLLAIVEDVTIESTDSSKQVLARSPTNIFNFRFVFVKK